MKADFHKYNKPNIKKIFYKVNKFYGVDRVSLDDTLSLGYAKYLCNLNVFNGRISKCFGVGDAIINGIAVPSGVLLGKLVKNADVYRKQNNSSSLQNDSVVLLLSDNKVYEAEVGVSKTLKDTGITVADLRVNFLNYYKDGKDWLLVFDGSGVMHKYDGNTTTKVSDIPIFGTVCVHKGRIYGGTLTEENKLKYSATLKPEEWNKDTTDAGEIEFPDEGGAIRKLIECGNELFIIRDYSVYKLSAYEDIADYTLTKLFSGNRRIYPETVANVDGKLVFLTEDGFYYYNGKAFEAIWKDLFPFIESAENGVAMGYGGKYYLSARFVTEGNEYIGNEEYCNYNNGIMAVSPITDEVSFLRGADISGFFRCNYGNKSYLLLRNSPGVKAMTIGMITDDGKIYGESVKKIWRSPKTPLDYIKEDKTVRKFYIKTNVPLTIKIMLDREYSYELPASNKIQCVAVNGRAEDIEVKLETLGDNPSISGFWLEIELTDRREYGGY